jgi:hypothetical protein
MNYEAGKTVVMKKQHPCGNNEFRILRVGMDFKLSCLKCGRELWLKRKDAEKSIKSIKEND